MKSKIAAVLAVVALTTGCATSNFQPRIDHSTSRNTGHYGQDITECRQLAANDHGGNAATAAGVGAILGALIGAAVGNSQLAAQGAAVGALSAGAGGLNRSVTDENRMISNCMRGRGYNVLN